MVEIADATVALPSSAPALNSAGISNIRDMAVEPFRTLTL